MNHNGLCIYENQNFKIKRLPIQSLILLDLYVGEDSSGIPGGLRRRPRPALLRPEHTGDAGPVRPGQPGRVQAGVRAAVVGARLQLPIPVQDHQERADEEVAEPQRDVHAEHQLRLAHHHRRRPPVCPARLRAALRTFLYQGKNGLQQS